MIVQDVTYAVLARQQSQVGTCDSSVHLSACWLGITAQQGQLSGQAGPTYAVLYCRSRTASRWGWRDACHADYWPAVNACSEEASELTHRRFS